MTYILTLDIGGTNSRMAMVEILHNNSYEVKIKKNIDKNLNSVIPAINKFLKECAEEKMTTGVCCACVAGPVENNACYHPTNAKFPIIGEDIENNTLLQNVLVINDFVAIGEVIASFDIENEIDKGNILEIKSGEKKLMNRGVLGPGTGLGMAYLIRHKEKYLILPSEGMHASIPEFHNDLFEYIKNKLNVNNLGFETLVSGQGIRLIIDFLLNNANEYHSYIKEHTDLKETVQKLLEGNFDQKKTDDELKNALYLEEIGDDIDPAELVSNLSKVNAKAFVTMYIFGHYLAIACQDIALHGLTKGGIFIGGGIATKNKFLFEFDYFKQSFEDNWKPNIVELLKKIPIYLITNYDISFIGCAKAGVQKFLK